jgi:hypothetical protein
MGRGQGETSPARQVLQKVAPAFGNIIQFFWQKTAVMFPDYSDDLA